MTGGHAITSRAMSQKYQNSKVNPPTEPVHLHVRQKKRQKLPTFSQHVEDMRPDKCDVFKNEVHYLGKVISADGYRMDNKEVAAVQALKTKPPTNIRELRKPLGFLGYYRS